MKKHLTLLLSVLILGLCQAAAQPQTADRDFCPDIRTVSLEVEGQPLSLPLLTLEGDEHLLLQFDLLGEEAPALRYTLLHCDAHWAIDDLQPEEFFSGIASGPIEDFAFSFNTTVPYVHYTQLLPDPYASFTHSGNYLLRVALADEEDSLLFTRRFYVSEQACRLEAQVVRPYDGHDIRARQQVDAYVSSRDLRLDPRYLTLTAMQNRRTDNRRDLVFSGYDRDRLAFRDRPANIFEGGNTFRFFDCSNLHARIYNIASIERYGGETFVILRPDENRSARHFSTDAVLMGGMKPNIVDRPNPNIEADYVWVNFSLPQSSPYLDGSLHLVGELTGWHIDSTSRLDYNPTYRSYTKRLQLKQGYYAYQILFLPSAPGSHAETARIEGNHYETPNRYTLFLYQHAPSDRADRLLSVGTAQP